MFLHAGQGFAGAGKTFFSSPEPKAHLVSL